MITRENFEMVINNIDPKDKKRIKNNFDTCKFEYLFLELHIFNAGSYVEAHLTNKVDKYMRRIDNGAALINIKELEQYFN